MGLEHFGDPLALPADVHRVPEPTHPSRVDRSSVRWSSPILDHPAGADPPASPGQGHQSSGDRHRRPFVAEIWPVVAIAAPVAYLDVGWALIVGCLVAGALLVRRVGHRVGFGFGDGFVAFRSDLGWPRGVQEDDDVHWRWRTTSR